MSDQRAFRTIVPASAQDAWYTRYPTFVIRLPCYGLWTLNALLVLQPRSITFAVSFTQFEVHPCLTTPDVNF